MARRLDIIRIAAFVLALAGVLWGFQAMLLEHAPSAFSAKEEDMSFAWYVPVFSLYVLWTIRRRVIGSVGTPSVRGLLFVFLFLAAGFFGARGVQLRIEIVAFVGLLVSLTWTVFGWRTARAILFPAGFLLFCIPLATFLDVVTVHLRLLATGAAYAVLRGFGAEVVRSGTSIVSATGAFAIDVAEPCSGLRSIFALMALTAGYAYFTQTHLWKQLLLFACSVPIAVLGNVVRILSICLVGTYADAAFATGFYHDYSGYVVFAAAIVLMVACGELINRLPARKLAPASRPASRPLRIRDLAVPLAALVVIVVAMVNQARVPEVTVAEAPEVRLPDLEGFEVEELEPAEAERQVLPADTHIEKRRYRDAAGGWYLVTLVVGGKSKSSIHRPELCLPAQGFLMLSPRTRRVDGRDWRFLSISRGGELPVGFAYTFFNQDGFRTSSHVLRILKDMWDRAGRNRIDRWCMLTVNMSYADDRRMAEFVSRLRAVDVR